MKRKILSHSEASVILSPFYGKISGAVQAGFNDYLRILDFQSGEQGYVPYHKRTKACIIHDNIQNRLNEAFAEVDVVEVGVWNEIFGIKIGEDLFIRFNKINDDHSSRGRATKQSKNYKNQMSIVGFPDEPTFLYAGYKPDPSWTQITGIYITCWDGERKVWVEEIISHTSSTQPVLPFETQEPDQTQQRRVKIKTDQRQLPETNTGTND